MLIHFTVTISYYYYYFLKIKFKKFQLKTHIFFVFLIKLFRIIIVEVLYALFLGG
jgi:hypothetical protein